MDKYKWLWFGYLLVLVHQNDTNRIFGHVFSMPNEIAFCDFYHSSMELVCLCCLLHFIQSLLLIFLHEIIIFEIKIIFYGFIELLFVQALPIIIILNLFLLVKENVFWCWNILSCFPITFLYMDIFPFCCDSSCHCKIFLSFFDFN